MRILHLKLCNLNSLRGEWQLDFEADPLGRAGLFAIVGDTGAGKTTLLDAITLALYGRIHRNKEVKEAVSYNTAETMAEVVFRVGAEVYQASWSVRRSYGKVDGKLQNPTHILRKLDPDSWEVTDTLSEKIKETQTVIETVTGLNFERFSRSILLAQGDFAAFLKANVEQRSELLEQITGTEIYSRISAATFERNKQEQEALNKLQEKLSNLSLMSPEELEANEAARTELKQEIDELDRRIKALQESILKWRELASNQQETEQVEAKLQSLQTELPDVEKQEQALAAHRKALPLQVELREHERLGRHIQELQTELETLEPQILENQSLKEANTVQLEQARNTLEELEQRKESELKLYDEVLALDAELERQKEQRALARRQLAEVLIEIDLWSRDSNHSRTELDKLQSSLQEINEWLKSHPSGVALHPLTPLEISLEKWQNLQERQQQLMQDKARQEKDQQRLIKLVEAQTKNLEEVEQNRTSLQQEFDALRPAGLPASPEELLDYLQEKLSKLRVEREQYAARTERMEQYRELLWEYHEAETQRRQLQSAEYVLNTELLDALQRADDAEAVYQERKEIYEREQRVANYEKDRAALKEGEPCPLCLSEEHPFRSEGLQTFEDRTRKDFHQAEKHRELAQRELRLLSEKQLRLVQEMRQLQDEQGGGVLPRLQQRILQLETQLAQGKESSTKFSEATLQQQEQQLAQLRALKKNLDEADRASADQRYQLGLDTQQLKNLEDARAQLLQSLDTQASALEKQATELNQLLQELGQELCPPEQIPGVLDRLKIFQVNYKKKQEEASSLDTQIRVLREKYANESDVLHRYYHQERELVALRDDTTDAIRVNTLKRESLLEYRDPREARQAFLNTLESAQKSLAAMEREQERLAGRKAQLEEQMMRARRQLTEAEQALSKLESTLQVNVSRSGFSSLELVKDALMPESKADESTNYTQEYRGQLRSLNDRLQALQAARQLLEHELTEVEPLKELGISIDALQSRRDALQQESGALQQAVRVHEQRVKDCEQLMEAIEKQRQACNHWSNLNKLIGSSDGKKFRAFAQGLTLQNLINLANQYLEKLHGRYHIRKKQDELDLEVIDTYQADHTRSMNTLSGGESFLMSLALALGLSDMASGRTRIESLFIDEGFGTLDEENLEMAVNTLENLQASGKSIGIISHVRELKERVTVQIQVMKKGSGNSEVRILENGVLVEKKGRFV